MEKEKSKKEFIIEFLSTSTEVDKHKAFESFKAVPLHPDVSQAFFGKVWVEVKGSTPKSEKTKVNGDGQRAIIGEMYKEQEKYQKVLREARIALLLTTNPEEKAKLQKDADAAIDTLASFNRTIRDAMEKSEK